jgi:hypothetical protein
VAANLKSQLWDGSKGAMYDRDANDTVVATLVHDNLRMMWAGAFDQSMADTFVTTHLMNQSEFFTAMPLPSISVSDPRYRSWTNANTWSGRPMGLTVQRAVRALERYGHHSESVLIGERLTTSILGYDGCRQNASHCHFTLQIDPLTMTPIAAPWAPKDGYGPMLLSFLEYSALRVGVIPRPPDRSMGPLRHQETLLWSSGNTSRTNQSVSSSMSANSSSSSTTTTTSSNSSMSASSRGRPSMSKAASNASVFAAGSGVVSNYTYTQLLGVHNFTLQVQVPSSNTASSAAAIPMMIGFRDAKQVFTCTAGVRVVTDLRGTVVGVIGISTEVVAVELTLPAAGSFEDSTAPKAQLSWQVKPNEEWALDPSSGDAMPSGGLAVARANSRGFGLKLLRAAPFVKPF